MWTLGGVGTERETAVRSCTVSHPSPGRLGADRAAPLHRSGDSPGRGMKRKGMLPGGRGGDWEVKKGVGVRPGAGELDSGKRGPRR